MEPHRPRKLYQSDYYFIYPKLHSVEAENIQNLSIDSFQKLQNCVNLLKFLWQSF